MLKKPLTLDEQVEQLKHHNIFVSDESKTKEILSNINYYRLTGYAIPFRIAPSKSDCLEGTTFDQIYQLYLFDAELRTMLRKYLECAEIYYKTIISYGFSLAKCSEPPHDQHYDRNNYFSKDKFDSIIESFRKEKNYYKDSLIVKHHKSKYNEKMPLWVILELLSFSNTSKLYYVMYRSEKEKIANTVGVNYNTLSNHLHCLSVLRNKCAHAARIYNTNLHPSVKFNKTFLKKHPYVKSNSLFAYMLMLMRRLPSQEIKKDFLNDTIYLIQKYQKNISLEHIGFPEHFKDIFENSI